MWFYFYYLGCILEYDTWHLVSIPAYTQRLRTQPASLLVTVNKGAVKSNKNHNSELRCSQNKVLWVILQWNVTICGQEMLCTHVWQASGDILTRMTGQMYEGSRVWSLSAPPSHSCFTWEAHLLWSCSTEKSRHVQSCDPLMRLSLSLFNVSKILQIYFLWPHCIIYYFLKYLLQLLLSWLYNNYNNYQNSYIMNTCQLYKLKWKQYAIAARMLSKCASVAPPGGY